MGVNAADVVVGGEELQVATPGVDCRGRKKEFGKN
jgi:hypothetical protein